MSTKRALLRMGDFNMLTYFELWSDEISDSELTQYVSECATDYVDALSANDVSMPLQPMNNPIDLDPVGLPPPASVAGCSVPDDTHVVTSPGRPLHPLG